LVRLQELKKVKSSALIFPKIPDGADVAQAAEILSKFSDQLKADILPIFNQISLLEKKSLLTTPLKSELVKTTQNGVGDVVYQNDEPIYVSIVL